MISYIFAIILPLAVTIESATNSFSKWLFFDSKAAMSVLDQCERQYAIYFEDRILYGRENVEWKSCGKILTMSDKVNFSKFWGIKGAAYLKHLDIKEESCNIYSMKISEGTMGRDLVYKILLKTFYGDFDYCQEIKGEAN